MTTESVSERVTPSRCAGVVHGSDLSAPRGGRRCGWCVLAWWPGDASCPRSAALGHRAASRDPSPSLGRWPWGPSQLSSPPPAHRGAPWGQPCHTSGRRGQEWARCPRAPWDLWCANWSLSSTFHRHLEEKRGQWTQWSITATQPAHASGRIPEALPVWPTSFLQPSRHLHMRRSRGRCRALVRLLVPGGDCSSEVGTFFPGPQDHVCGLRRGLPSARLVRKIEGQQTEGGEWAGGLGPRLPSGLADSGQLPGLEMPRR